MDTNRSLHRPESFGARTALLIATAVSIGIAMMPWSVYAHAAWPLMIFSTFAHEMGHGLTAVMLGGTFDKFVMSPDGAGMATYHFNGGGGRIADALVSAGGLVGPAVLGALFFLFARSARASRGLMLGLGVCGALSLLLVVRNGFGLIYVLCMSGVFLAVALIAPAQLCRLVVAFLGVQLAICVYTRSDYLFTETAGGNQPSDVAQMARALVLPYWFWGALCAAFSAYVLYRGVRATLKSGS